MSSTTLILKSKANGSNSYSPLIDSGSLNWLSYSFASDFMTPTDAFTVAIGDENLNPDLRSKLQAGTQVQFLADIGDGSLPRPLFTGFLDQIELDDSRSGTILTLRGRDVLGPVCDSQINPWSTSFVEGQTLADVIGSVFSRFDLNDIYLTDAANRSIVSGSDVAAKNLIKKFVKVTSPSNLLSENPTLETTTQTVTQYIDPTAPKDLTTLKGKRFKPTLNETYYSFAERAARRFHLHIWAMPDGSGIVVSAADFSQPPLYTLTAVSPGSDKAATANIISGGLAIDYFNQPSIIFGRSTGGGGDVPYGRYRCAIVNEFIGYDSKGNRLASIDRALGEFKNLQIAPERLALIANYSQFFNPPDIPRTVFLEDQASMDGSQLQSFAQRKMVEYQSKALILRYTVQDHHQNGNIWRVNTIATVNDEVRKINGNFWISAVAFKKSRNGGTTSDLTLIPVDTLTL